MSTTQPEEKVHMNYNISFKEPRSLLEAIFERFFAQSRGHPTW